MNYEVVQIVTDTLLLKASDAYSHAVIMVNSG